MGDRGRLRLPAAVEAGDESVRRHVDDPASAFLLSAHAWVELYWNARHLERTLDWLLVLDPAASESMQLAALTHDMERHFPGGPVMDPATTPPDDEHYRRAHAERSARIVGEWLRDEGGPRELVADVERLILAHEIGGEADEDLIQAADSLSFLEVNAELMARWFTDGRCDRDRAKAQLTYMYERIRLHPANELARPLYEEALAVVDRA